jgi:hypothetical protein
MYMAKDIHSAVMQKPEPRKSQLGHLVLTVTPAECAAAGRSLASFELDLDGLEFMLLQVFGSADPNLLAQLMGPPGGPLMARVLAGSAASDLQSIIRTYVAPATDLRLGEVTTVQIAGRDCEALAFEHTSGPAWRSAPSGCALRVGSVVALLEAEGTGLDVAKALAHPELGLIAVRLAQGAGPSGAHAAQAP